MKRTIATVFLTFIVTLLLFGGSNNQIVNKPVEAQTLTPNADLASAFRRDVNDFFNALESFQAHKHEKDDRNLTFVAGDLIGVNANVTAANLNQAVVDFNTIYNAIRSGGTISAGVWANVIKIK